MVNPLLDLVFSDINEIAKKLALRFEAAEASVELTGVVRVGDAEIVAECEPHLLQRQFGSNDRRKRLLTDVSPIISCR